MNDGGGKNWGKDEAMIGGGGVGGGAMKPAFGAMIALYTRPSDGDMTGTNHWFTGGTGG